MKDPIITYRGASCPMSELSDQRVSQLEQQQGTRRVQYRGQTMETPLHVEDEKKMRTITYRGATAEMEV
ncbi:MAG: hypothetical protein P1V20_18910 [Verrucomicrobiales bacterium]|nr:hypothetical protein [Verrucomicrobiales bacterium]